MSENVEFSLDLTKVYTALGTNQKFIAYLEKIAREIEKEAEQKARIEAYDEGYYMDLFASEALSVNKVRKLFLDSKGRYNKRKRGQDSDNRILDRKKTVITDPNDGRKKITIYESGDINGWQYKGYIGAVYNTDFKAVWVEYGSIAKGPKFILTRSGEEVASRYNLEFEKLWFKTNEQNTDKLGSLQSKGKAEMKNVRASLKTIQEKGKGNI